MAGEPGCMTAHNGRGLVLRGGGAQLECSPMNDAGSTPAGGRTRGTASALFRDPAGSDAGEAADRQCMTLRGGGRGVGDRKINNIPRWDWTGPGDTSQDWKLRKGSKARKKRKWWQRPQIQRAPAVHPVLHAVDDSGVVDPVHPSLEASQDWLRLEGPPVEVAGAILGAANTVMLSEQGPGGKVTMGGRVGGKVAKVRRREDGMARREGDGALWGVREPLKAMWRSARLDDAHGLRHMVRKQGADVNTRDPRCLNATALHVAAGRGHLATLKRLLKYGADPNALADDGHSPLHWAASMGHASAVNLLLKAGAEVSAETSLAHITPLAIAIANGHQVLAEQIRAATGVKSRAIS